MEENSLVENFYKIKMDWENPKRIQRLLVNKT